MSSRKPPPRMPLRTPARSAPRMPSRLAAPPVRQPGEPPAGVIAAAHLATRIGSLPDLARVLLAVLLALAGSGLAVFGALADVTLHRGVETGAETPFVRHMVGRDLAVNVDLWRVEPAQVPVIAEKLRQAGFRYVRLSIPWREIEPAMAGFRWDRADAIIDALSQGETLAIVAVLHQSPGWARASAQTAATDAPPIDPRAFERFVLEFSLRYGGKVAFVQLWDLPNRPDHWGGTVADPLDYFTLLSTGANVVRKYAPATGVVLAELDPAPSPDSRNTDLAFLRDLYRLGAAPLFDVVAARVDGGNHSPYDRVIDPARTNLSRAILIRETMVAAGDAAKPLWATHYGWRAGVAPGDLDPAAQAAFTIAGIERSRSEWPWLGPLFAWQYAPRGSADDGYALLANAGSLLGALGSFFMGGGTNDRTDRLSPGRGISVSLRWQLGTQPARNRNLPDDDRGRVPADGPLRRHWSDCPPRLQP